jgi:hypothetical protein
LSTTLRRLPVPNAAGGGDARRHDRLRRVHRRRSLVVRSENGRASHPLARPAAAAPRPCPRLPIGRSADDPDSASSPSIVASTSAALVFRSL